MSSNWPSPHLLLALIATLAWPLAARGIELPAALLEELKAENFAARERAEAELLAWTRQRADASLEALYQQSRSAADPELRERCLSVLRELVTDEYLRNGVGYVGIRMNPNTEAVNVPGEAKPRFAIRVLQVEPATPAHKAGLLGGDLLLSVNDAVWQQADTSAIISEKIKSFKAGTEVTLKLFRDGNIVAVPLVLGRRPAGADLLQFQFGLGGMQASPEAAAAAERTARQEYFRRWLAARKTKD
jgi:predicted metalloprotease with PDZ domain